MSYQLNKTDGTILTDLIDGQIDTSSTNLVLVGRNYTGYGEFFNENFIKLLENFASTAPPSNPLQGQIWWNKTEERLEVYTGEIWKTTGGPIVQAERPQMIAGDLWINNFDNQVYAYDGTDLILVGPPYTASQGRSGFIIESFLDRQNRGRTVANMYINNELAVILSNAEFVPLVTEFQRVPRLNLLVTNENPEGRIYQGFNVLNKDSFRFNGVAEAATAFYSAGGEIRRTDQFLPSDRDGITIGTLTIQNAGGLTIGLSQNNVQKVIGSRFYIENQRLNHDMSLRVRSGARNSLITDAVFVKADTAHVGIFRSDPQYTLDVAGDLRVTGNMLVEGETISIDVTNLRVEDKNIELAVTSAGDTLSNVEVDGGGITLRSTDGDKTLVWRDPTGSWTSNVDFDLNTSARVYRIAGEAKLTTDSLVNIQHADDLTTIGTLEFLNVDTISIDDNVINSSGELVLEGANGIRLIPYGGVIMAGDSLLKGIGDPVDEQDATNKRYVDNSIAMDPIALAFDTTGLGTGQALYESVAEFLEDLYPPEPANAGRVARIHATTYAGATVSGITVPVNKSTVLVDANGTLNQSVIQDFVLGSASGPIQFEPSRSLMIFICDGTNWVYDSDTEYT